MPISSVVSPSPIQWVRDTTWPDPGVTTGGQSTAPGELANNIEFGFPRVSYGGGVASLGEIAEVAGPVDIIAPGLGDVVTPPRAQWFYGARIDTAQSWLKVAFSQLLFPLGGASVYPPGWQSPNLHRVYWLQMGIRQMVLASEGCGLQGVLDSSGATSWQSLSYPTATFIRGGWGVVADGSGGWSLRSWDTAGAVLRSVPLPGALGELCSLDILGVNASRTRPAGQLRIIWNGEVVADWSWDPAALDLPPTQVFSGGGQITTRLQYHFGIPQALNVGELHMGYIRLRQGSYLPSGQELVD